ncbi:hypothetical protein [Amycolatopsis palatopharyngis]|uniref:hypothetical protein n=1 Tax=Amycolatopsis palatopharyngis TaxID=187982 RepID=UPI0013BE97E9|nr:hypothetical protein [Amycolatopsis palatopharyngis]
MYPPSHRTLAMLRAVAAGRGQVTCSSEPDLFVDGVPCCDQFTAHALTHSGLIRPGRLGLIGQRVPAALTDAGHALLTATATAA